MERAWRGRGATGCLAVAVLAGAVAAGCGSAARPGDELRSLAAQASLLARAAADGSAGAAFVRVQAAALQEELVGLPAPPATDEGVRLGAVRADVEQALAQLATAPDAAAAAALERRLLTAADAATDGAGDP